MILAALYLPSLRKLVCAAFISEVADSRNFSIFRLILCSLLCSNGNWGRPIPEDVDGADDIEASDTRVEMRWS